jgi:rhodanese-related sulfurtransferase
MILEAETVVYPAHGAGTLCGKNLSKESTSTIGKEKETNWCLQQVDKQEFVNNLLENQPFVPAYFPYDVELNKKGAPHMEESVAAIKKGAASNLDEDLWVVDVRKEDDFKEGHLPYSVNIQEDGKFETWLGSIINPEEQFYIAANDEEQLQRVLLRIASIGYETAVAEALVVIDGAVKEAKLDVDLFKKHTSDYTIVDVRNEDEVEEGNIFENSISIPLAELRGRISEIPTDKPIVVHCAGGYRSAAASSLIHSMLNGSMNVFDLSESIEDFTK